MTDEQVEALSYNEKCSMLNLNPVVVAKHYQYWVEMLFKEVLMTNANPIGKIIYYDSKLHELVSTYQKHTHCETCRKYKNIPCRFNFGQFFTQKTMVAKPLSDD